MIVRCLARTCPTYTVGYHISRQIGFNDAPSLCKTRLQNSSLLIIILTWLSNNRLLQVPILQQLSDGGTTTLIRSCTLGEASATVTETIQNPKKENSLAIAKLQHEPSCISRGSEIGDRVQLYTSRDTKQKDGGERASALLKGIQMFFTQQENCDEHFIFAYYNETLAGVYMGGLIGRETIVTSLQSLLDIYEHQPFPARAVAELCHGNSTDSAYVMGVTLENTRDLASVQRTASAWSKGNCSTKERLQPAGDLPGANVLHISLEGNGSLSSNASHLYQRQHSKHSFTSRMAINSRSFIGIHQSHVDKRTTCGYVTVVDGDSCSNLVSTVRNTGVLVTFLFRTRTTTQWSVFITMARKNTAESPITTARFQRTGIDVR
jgi:hypothetical protein